MHVLHLTRLRLPAIRQLGHSSRCKCAVLQGYPGNLTIHVTYQLTPRDALILELRAVTDKATPVSLTSLANFNLGGHDNELGILDHRLTING